MTATHLLWSGAGRPSPEGAVPYDGRCWWCGFTAPGLGRPVNSAIPDTFPDRARALVASASCVCAPCAWTLSDRIALPAELADAGLAKRLDEGGRLRVSVRGDDPRKPRLFLRLADGRIGIWPVGKNAAADEPWLAARANLRENPEGAVDIVADTDIANGPTARFRNYHHLGTPASWRPCTNADRGIIREWLLHPPETEPWVCVIGDGQKHAAIYADDAVVEPGSRERVYFDGAVLGYSPGALARDLDAIEQLRLAGASDDEVRTGHYRRVGVLAWRRWEPVVVVLRGRPAYLDLCLFLRRLPKEFPDV